jgi:hypothetical protein
MSVWDDLIARAVAVAPMLLANRIVAQFEPMPAAIDYRTDHAYLVRSAISATGHDGFAAFPEPLGRNAFIVAALEHLAPIRDREELIVAFGKRRGSRDEAPSRLEGLWRGIGGRDEVSITPLLRDTVQKQSGAMDRSEIIFVHNHPEHDVKSLIRFLFGWTPLASSPDRDTALRMNLTASLRSMLGHANHFRFYLVDEGKLARFWLPSVETFMALLGNLKIDFS